MAANDPVEVRIEKMATWAKGVSADIKALQARILPTDAECDEASAELGALYEKYSTVRDDARETRNNLGEIDDELRQLKEPMAVMEAQASLGASYINPDTKKAYTVAARKSLVTVALGSNEDYQKLVTRKHVLERQKAGAQAILADCDTALSMYRNRNRALVARLGNLTARMGK